VAIEQGQSAETGAETQDTEKPVNPTKAVDKAAIDRAFTELYQENLKDVYSFLYYRLGNHHDAEDVSEQVFLQAYRHLPKALAESQGRSLRPWLIRIAQNLAINLYRDRSRKPQSPLDAAGEFADRHDTENLVESREELSDIFEKVAELGDDRREALIMRFALGMDNHEIARAMGKTEGATKVLLHRAIKQLEEQLEERP
jgi:RNA polymerase sigma-70 factor (ECF subfamily)